MTSAFSGSSNTQREGRGEEKIFLFFLVLLSVPLRRWFRSQWHLTSYWTVNYKQWFVTAVWESPVPVITVTPDSLLAGHCSHCNLGCEGNGSDEFQCSKHKWDQILWEIWWLLYARCWQQCCSRFKSSGILHWVGGRVVSDVSEDRRALGLA